ncbi:MAG: hypothetical protein LV468_02000 [Candidatus Nitrosotenuis sp.]|nr:hypothetical protein [Candidatus Nitrosotenuis sp.]
MGKSSMDLRDLVPVLLYDNKCYLCTKFARAANFLAGGRLCLVGHYTDLGEKIRSQVLDSSALEMFWFIDGRTAFGGRAALLPLISSLLGARSNSAQGRKDLESCGMECKTVKAAFIRSASLLTHSKKITIKPAN